MASDDDDGSPPPAEQRLSSDRVKLDGLRTSLKNQIHAYEMLAIGNSGGLLSMVICNLQDIVTRFDDTEPELNEAPKKKKKKKRSKRLSKKKEDEEEEDEKDEELASPPLRKRKSKRKRNKEDEDVEEGSDKKGECSKTVEEHDTPRKKKKKTTKQDSVDVNLRSPSPLLAKHDIPVDPLPSFLSGVKIDPDSFLLKNEVEEYEIIEIPSSPEVHPDEELPPKVEGPDPITQEQVWKSVFKRLSWADLRNCRLVHSTFKRLGVQELLQRDLCLVRLTFHEGSEQYLHYSSYNVDPNRVRCLLDLNDVMQRAKLFPCRNFSFHGGNLIDGGAKEFFQKHANTIKTLRIRRAYPYRNEATRYQLQQETLRKVLLHYAPNVETLRISCFQYTWNDSDLLYLRSLKSLTCTSNCLINKECPKSTAFAMLSYDLNNLESVYNFKAQYLSPLFATRTNLQKIKSYRLEIFEVDPNALLTFSNSGVSLERLTVFYPNDGKTHRSEKERQEKEFLAAEALNKILNSSKKSLVKLDTTAFGLLDNRDKRLKIPEMTNLQELTMMRRWIEIEQGGISPMFPVETQLKSTFPNLKVVNIFLNCFRDEFYKDYFPPRLVVESQFPTVTTLGLGGFCSYVWYKNFKTMFPNVKKLVSTCRSTVRYMGLDRTIKYICTHFEDLEELEFLGCTWWNVKFPGNVNFDVALTGISKVDCDKVKWTKMDDMPQVTEFKRVHCLTDLKSLKKLKIRISNESWKVNAMPRFDLISRLSGIYAFQLMPPLKVVIAYHQFCPSSSKISDCLESIAPYVTLIHEKHEEYERICKQ